MDINYIETVLRVVNLGGYAKAAKEIPCSQSSVSRQINKVEEELGAPIFNHVKGGKVELTPFGESIVPQLQAIISNWKYVVDTADRTLSDGQTAFRLGIIRGPFNSYAIGKLMYQSFLNHPEIVISTINVGLNQIKNSLLSGEVDAVLMYESYCPDIKTKHEEYDSDTFACVPLFRKHPSIAMVKDHPLASMQSISLGKLKYETFIVCDLKNGPTELNTFFESNCKKYGFTPKERVLSRASFSETRDAAVCSKGWMYPTFQTKFMANNEHINLVAIEEPTYYADYRLIYRKDSNLDMDAVSDILKSQLTKDDISCYPL